MPESSDQKTSQKTTQGSGSLDVNQASVEYHRLHQGKLKTELVSPITDKAELSLAYTPGVAEPCRVIAANPEESFNLTWRGRTVAVISDGSAVLGLGNIGAAAALPVMEGKSILLKQFGGVDSVPLVIETQDSQEIIKFVRQVAPSFGGINLEDIAAPRCFEIEEALQDLGIPVFHDDQHGTAIVVTAALHNAAKVVGKRYEDLKVVIVGSGAAGLATARMLLALETAPDGSWYQLPDQPKVADLISVDSTGAIYEGRENLPGRKALLAAHSNRQKITGDFATAIRGADVVIGVSRPGLITSDMIKTMADQPIVFALANPTPEIMPDEARTSGAAVVATGRSDFPNQINNVLAFPAVFKAALELRVPKIDTQMKIAASKALAAQVPAPSMERIMPDPFTPNLTEQISRAIIEAHQ